MSAPELAAALLDELRRPLGVEGIEVAVDDVPAARDWIDSGAAALTGRADGPPLAAPGAPASCARAALAVAGAYLSAPTHPVTWPGVGVLGERAALAGLRRRAPFSVGGAFRCLPTRDGFFGLSLVRASDIALLPALTRGRTGPDPWEVVREWLADSTTAEAGARVQELGLPGAAVPEGPGTERRAPVSVVSHGGARSPTRSPLVVDLTSLWAGPLCARLLGLGGARVVKVESVDRPDAARQGNAAFFDLLHAGHAHRVIDFATDIGALKRLLARADVVLESSRPRALAQLGIDAREYVSEGAVWVGITAYGRAGDDAMRVGFGDDVAAGGGLVAWLDGQPVPLGDALADPLTGVHAAAAAAVALRGERGCLLDVSMHDVSRRAAAVPTGSVADAVRAHLHSGRRPSLGQLSRRR